MELSRLLIFLAEGGIPAPAPFQVLLLDGGQPRRASDVGRVL